MADCCEEIRKELAEVKAELQKLNGKFIPKTDRESIILDSIKKFLGDPRFLAVAGAAYAAKELAEGLTNVRLPALANQIFEAKRNALEALYKGRTAFDHADNALRQAGSNSSKIGDLLNRINQIGGRVSDLAGKFGNLLSKLQPLFALLGVLGLLLSLAQLVGTLQVIFPRLNAIDARLASFETGLSQSLGLIQQAFSRATRALDAANTADGKAERAIKIADDTKDIAFNANSNSISAREKAEKALFESGNAQAKANTAIGIANTAIATANSAIGSANSANANANDARKTAVGASNLAENVLKRFHIFERKFDETINTIKGEIISTGVRIREELNTKLKPIEKTATNAQTTAINASGKANEASSKADSADKEVKEIKGIIPQFVRWPQVRNEVNQLENKNNLQDQQIQQNKEQSDQKVRQAINQITNINQTVNTIKEGSPVDAETKQQLNKLSDDQNKMILMITTLSVTVAGLINAQKQDLSQIRQNTSFGNLSNAAATGTCRTTQPGGCSRKMGEELNNSLLDKINNSTNKLDGPMQAAQLGYLMTINNKLGPQVPGGVSGFLSKIQSFAEKAWQSTRLDKVISYLTLFTTLHNALMLSSNLAVTLGGVVDNGLNLFGVKIKDENGEQINFNQMLGNTVRSTIQNVIGVQNYNALTTAYKQANRIYQAGMNVIFTVQSLYYSTKVVTEYIASGLGRIGNGLKKERVVGPSTWPWMSENVTSETATTKRINDVMNGVSAATDGLSALDAATASAVSARDSINELKNNKAEFNKALEDADSVELKNNVPKTAEFNSSKAASQNTSSTFPDVAREAFESIEP